jgi:hypothetical protein
MFLRNGRKAMALLGLVALLGVAACGEDGDDGPAVRESGDTGGSASASGPASASGSGSASGTAEGAAECVYVGNSAKTPTAWVDITLTEFSLAPVPDEVPAGTVEFIARNEGAEAHELVIVKYDGDAGDLPTGADGEADEAGLPEGTEVLEIEGFGGGQICAASFDLAPGKYALFCNIVEEEDNGDKEAHYAMGMHTNFTVS